MTSWTCVASSRVGTRTSARGRRGRDGYGVDASGIPKASVLPEPVGALPQMSRPGQGGRNGLRLNGEWFGDP